MSYNVIVIDIVRNVIINNYAANALSGLPCNVPHWADPATIKEGTFAPTTARRANAKITGGSAVHAAPAAAGTAHNGMMQRQSGAVLQVWRWDGRTPPIMA